MLKFSFRLTNDLDLLLTLHVKVKISAGFSPYANPLASYYYEPTLCLPATYLLHPTGRQRERPFRQNIVLVKDWRFV